MIQERAMLCTLSISAWTARKQDKKVSAEVESAHGAHNAGKFNKLLVDKALLDPITKLAARIRESHYFATLPWSDSGARLLPSKLFMDYTAKIRGFKDEFNKLVAAMLLLYPAEVQAARVRLGTMYEPSDYPEAWELKDRFSINVDFTPVPDAADFRVDVTAEEQAELRASVTQGVADKQAAAVKATYARVREVVEKIDERLSVPGALFRDSLIDNARELCVVLEALNVTGDPAITKLAEAIDRDLLRYTPAFLRQSMTARVHTADLARAILATLP